MGKDIPNTWVELKINELTKVVAGGTPSTTRTDYFDGNVPWITPADLSGYTEKYIGKGRKNLSELGLKNSSAKLLPANTVLFSSRAPIGYVAIAKNELATNQGFKNLLPNEFYDPSFAYYYLKHIKDFVESQASGTTFKEISGSKMGELPFLLPPLEEQRRISKKLDELFAHMDLVNRKLDIVPELIKAFRESVLTLAVSGRLSEEVFSEEYYSEIESRYVGNKDINPCTTDEIRSAKQVFNNFSDKSWRLYPLELLVDFQRGIPYGIVQTGNDVENGVPTVRAGDIKGLEIKEGLKKVDKFIEEQYSRTRLKGGEVLLSIRGTVGNAAVAPDQYVGYNISREVALIPVIPAVYPKYIAILLQSPEGFKILSDKVKGIAQRGINLSDLRRFPVPLPTINEQKKIVEKVEALYAKADSIEAHYLSLMEKAINLPKILLSKAFKGELAEKDERDEPAGELLMRIIESKKREVVNLTDTKSKLPQSKPMVMTNKPLKEEIYSHFKKGLFSFEDLSQKLRSRQYTDIRDELYRLLEGNTLVAVFDAKKEKQFFQLKK
jgi:type I restriction enzyme S subunit